MYKKVLLTFLYIKKLSLLMSMLRMEQKLLLQAPYPAGEHQRERMNLLYDSMRMN